MEGSARGGHPNPSSFRLRRRIARMAIRHLRAAKSPSPVAFLLHLGKERKPVTVGWALQALSVSFPDVGDGATHCTRAVPTFDLVGR